MKKFTFKGVLDGFRSSVQQQSKPEQEIQETLRVDHFLLRKTFRHGFPNSPTALAYDPVQKLLVIGDKTGSLRFLGRPGVDTHVRHEGDSACAVVCIEFLVNEGALVTATADDTLHLWNFRQKTPQVVQSLKFQRERITCLHLPVASKWLYVGTEKGNIHVVHIEKFALSGYIINWNKAIEVVRTTHPGAVVQLVDNPLDANKLLIAYESGQIVLWDLRGKSAEMRWQSAEPLRSVAWHHEGKNFVSSHTDGSLCTWPLRPSPKPAMLSFPHAKTNKEGKLEACKPIHKVDLRTAATGETYTIFSGGLSIEKGGKSPCITVIQGKSTTVLEMEHPVVDFITICESPWASEMQEPYAIAVLLQNDLVLIDLLTAGFPCFESPYPMDLHESPVTCCTYLADCPSDLVPAFYSVGRIPGARRTTIFSNREWPVSGGEWSPASCSYSEIVITGHQDGSIKFWDSSAGTLQILYKLKTGKIFERPRTRSVDGSDDDPLAVQIISLCAESRRLCVAGTSGHVILFKFRKSECTAETLVLEIPISYESFDDQPDASPECEFVPRTVTVPSKVADPNVGDAAADRKFDGMLRVRPGPQRKPAGFQAQLVCLTPWTNATHPGQITSLSINSSYGLMAYGTEHGLVIVDFVQKVCLVNVASPDLYGTQDPYSRMPRSPKQRTDLQYRSAMSTDEQGRSPSIDQLSSEGGSATTTLGVSPKGAKSSSISIAGNSRPESPGDTLESPTGIGEVPSSNAASQGRRKSTGWKAFNLKRQLSKVNMKLAFNNNTDGTKRSTTELSPVEISPAISSGDTGPGSSTPTPTSETLDQDKSDYIEQLEKDIVSSLNENEDTTDQTPTEEVQLELPQQFPPQQRKEKKRVDFCADNEMSRPSDLPLSLDELEIDDDATDTEDYDFTPQPPPRYKKRIVDKQRLLSVPNIKYVKQDFLPVQDLRKTSASAACGVSSITGSGMSRSVVAGSYSGGGVGGTGVSGGGGGSGQTGSVSMAGSLIRRFNLCELAHQLLYLAYERCQKYYINVFVGCKRNDKLDSSFSRSRSSSMSSLENITSEAVTCISFADSYTKKSDPSALIPTLWVGTSLGSVLTVSIILPDAECRKLQPVVVSILGGPIFRLKGPILSMSFLDCNGALIPYSYEAWRDDNRPDSRSGGSITAISAGSVEKSRDRTPTKNPNRMSPTLGAAGGIAGGGGVVGGGVSSIDSYGSDRQFIAITSEKQSRVVALPSQYCAYRQQIASESDFVIKAEIISVKESVCLACYLSTGHLQAYSLPSLRLLLDFDFLPLHDLSFQTKCKQGIVDPMLSIWGQQLIVHEDTNQIGKTFCFSNKGHGLYLATPTELQKFTICSEFCNYFNEMMGELFSPHDMPEPPKESFFKGLFGGGPRNLDREELFGESSGKANRSVAKHIPGPNLEQLGARASTATSEIARAHMLAMERGDKLNRLEESSERMANQAQEFGSSAHSLMLKYKDKKWYQL